MTPSDQRGWTPCTAACKHRGPYRVHYRSGDTALINTEGCAPAGYALLDPVIVTKVTAPHGDAARSYVDRDTSRWTESPTSHHKRLR